VRARDAETGDASGAPVPAVAHVAGESAAANTPREGKSAQTDALTNTSADASAQASTQATTQASTQASPEAPADAPTDSTTDAPIDAQGTESTSDTPPEPPAPQASFLKEKKRMSRGSRWAWGIATVLLLALALLQFATLAHDEIGQRLPESKPYLAELCNFTRQEIAPYTRGVTTVLSCKVSVKKNAREITVEGDTLSNDGNAVLMVSALLKNRASYAQPFPQLEVTLIDASDQVITRRVLEAKAYAEKPNALEKEFAAGSELPVRFYLDAKELKPARYQLYVFHP
jgi:hypothetical protein